MNTIKKFSQALTLSMATMAATTQAADRGQFSADSFVDAVLVTHSDPVRSTAERRGESAPTLGGPEYFVANVLQTAPVSVGGSGRVVRGDESYLTANSAELFVARVLVH